MKRTALLLVLASLLVLAVNLVGGMSSTNYRLDWYVLLTGDGAGETKSTHYAANSTIGQTAIGTTSSSNYSAGLGYWYGVDETSTGNSLYLPLTVK